MDMDALPSEARRLSMPFSRMTEAEAAEAPLITPIEAITMYARARVLRPVVNACADTMTLLMIRLVRTASDVDFLDKFAFDIAAMKENIGEDNLESAARCFAENKVRATAKPVHTPTLALTAVLFVASASNAVRRRGSARSSSTSWSWTPSTASCRS